MCGKDHSLTSAIASTSGSPPHVRERLTRAELASFLGGITPACAGKTFRDATGVQILRDHPRMCGKDRP